MILCPSCGGAIYHDSLVYHPECKACKAPVYVQHVELNREWLRRQDERVKKAGLQ